MWRHSGGWGQYLAEEIAEGRVSQCVGLVRAELQHGDGVGRREVDSLGLRLEAGDGGINCESQCIVRNGCAWDDLQALAANFAATVLPMLPLLATFEFKHTS